MYKKRSIILSMLLALAMMAAGGNALACEGKIIVKKVMVGGAGTFNFTGEINDSISVNEGTLSKEVAPGTYYVTESATPGWDLTSISCVCKNPCGCSSSGDLSQGKAKFIVRMFDEVTCTFTNTKRGHIVVDKVTDPAGDPQSFDFTVTGSGYANFSLTDAAAPDDQELVPGTYTISETAVAGWEPVSAMCARPGIPSAFLYTPGSPLNLDAGVTWNCTFANTKKGHLIVQKTTVPAGDPTVFNITASGSGTITGGGSGTVSDAQDMDYEVMPGTYSVSETADSAVWNTDNQCAGIAVAAGETKYCQITNTKKKAHLTVTKYVDNGPLGVSDFPLFVTPEGGSAQSVTSGISIEIDPGSYTVGETNNYSYYDSAVIGGDCDSDGTISVAPGQDAKCTIHNGDSQPAKLIVIKRVVNDNGGGAVPADFDITVSGTKVLNAEFDGASDPGTEVYLHAGSYSVAETGPDGYDSTMENCRGTIGLNETKTCIISNNDKAPYLKLLKVVAGCKPGIMCGHVNCPDAKLWTLTATGTVENPTNLNGKTPVESKADFKADTYSLDETGGPDGYSGTWNCDGATLGEGNVITLGLGKSATCTVTNTKDVPPTGKVGWIKVIKYAIGGAQTFQFNGSGGIGDFSIPTANAGWLKMAKGVWKSGDLPAGNYLIKETVPAGWKQTVNTCKYSAKVKAGKVTTCVIVNVKKVDKPGCGPKPNCGFKPDCGGHIGGR